MLSGLSVEISFLRSGWSPRWEPISPVCRLRLRGNSWKLFGKLKALRLNTKRLWQRWRQKMPMPLWQSEVTEWQTDDGITVIRRKTFCAERFPYKPGEHVVFGGPSTRGKTTMAFDLLEYVATEQTPAYVAVSKPQDPVTAQRGKELDFRRVTNWPPEKKLGELLGGKKPSGYLIWPQFGDLDSDMERAAIVTDKLL